MQNKSKIEILEIKNDIFENSKQEKSEPCFKQTVSAMIETVDGQIIYGNNDINNQVSSCPREAQGYESGQGYHLCKEVCNQNSHAEVTAIDNAKKLGCDIEDATLTLIGHTYCCDNCMAEMNKAKIKVAHVILENEEILTYNLLSTRLKSKEEVSVKKKKPKKRAMSR